MTVRINGQYQLVWAPCWRLERVVHTLTVIIGTNILNVLKTKTETHTKMQKTITKLSTGMLYPQNHNIIIVFTLYMLTFCPNTILVL